jgi:hypothetical protein
MLAEGPDVAAIAACAALDREPVGNVEQHHAVHAKAEEHRRRARGRCRQRDTRQTHRAEDDQQREGRGHCAEGDEPEAAERDEQQRQDQREGDDAAQHALTLDDPLGLDGNPVPAGDLDFERRRDLRPQRLELLHERRGEVRIVGGAFGPREQQPAAAVHAAISARAGEAAACRARQLRAQQREQVQRVLLHHRFDLGGSEREQFARRAHRGLDPAGLEAAERRVEALRVEQQQLAVGQPVPVAADAGARVHRGDAGHGGQCLGHGVDVIAVVGDIVAVGYGQHDEELFARGESLRQHAERGDRRAGAGQQLQHVGVEREARHADQRERRQHRRQRQHRGTPPVGQDDDLLERGMHSLRSGEL